jgi:mono/diheme cytochrome c family protein
MKRLIGLSMAGCLALATGACGGDGGESDAAAETPAQAADESPDASNGATTPAASGQEPIQVDPAVLPEGVTAEMVQQGQQVFHGAGICYTCHTQGGGGGPLAPNLTDETWLNIDGEYQSIIELVNTGVPQPKEHPGAMLPKAGMPLTDDQIAAVAAYVYVLNK